MPETPTAKESLTRIGRTLAAALARVFTGIGGILVSMFAAYERRYPAYRRAAAWDKTIATFDQAFVATLTAGVIALLGLSKVGAVDALAIGKAVLELDLPTIGTILLGAFLGGFTGAVKAWRRWAVFNGPALTEADLNLAAAKGLT